MKDFYLNSIKAKKRGNKELYEKLILKIFGRKLLWNEVSEANNDQLISLMCELEKEIKIKESQYDISKLARAIQLSRSGAGLCAITEFECLFCGAKENWGNTAIPKICRECSTKMATNIVISKMDILKEK
jgi:hypothetical protein